jgi:Fe-S cluster biogenesis protein NfuA
MPEDVQQDAVTAAVLVVLDTQIRPLLAVHGGGLELIEVTPAGEVAVEGVRLSRAALDRVARMYGNCSPWVGVSNVAISHLDRTREHT